MSVDIVGSTQFKQVLSHKGRTNQKVVSASEDLHPAEPWLSPILEFYEQFSSTFDDIWERHAKSTFIKLGWPEGERPTIWKAVGDELIFTKLIKDHREAYICMTAWTETTRMYRKRTRFQGAGLDLKCSAWIAGFPVNNAEVILYDHSISTLEACDDGDFVYGNLSRLKTQHDGQKTGQRAAIRDFIGPSIDTGFRVASASSPRRFVITVDLAFILAHVAGNLGTFDPPIAHLVFSL